MPGSNTKKRRIPVIEHGGSARVEVAAGQLANDPHRDVSLGEHRLALAHPLVARLASSPDSTLIWVVRMSAATGNVSKR